MSTHTHTYTHTHMDTHTHTLGKIMERSQKNLQESTRTGKPFNNTSIYIHSSTARDNTFNSQSIHICVPKLSHEPQA